MDAVVSQLEGQGLTVYTEVTFETSAGRTRVDIVAVDPDGNLSVYEVKNGTYAKLTSNQVANLTFLQLEGGIPRGLNASTVPGLTVGAQTGPIDVYLQMLP